MFLLVDVSLDQGGRRSGGRSAVWDADCDEGQQLSPTGHGLFPGQDLSVCHVWLSGEETPLFWSFCQKSCWAGWACSDRRKPEIWRTPAGSSHFESEPSACWCALEWVVECIAWKFGAETFIWCEIIFYLLNFLGVGLEKLIKWRISWGPKINNSSFWGICLDWTYQDAAHKAVCFVLHK